MSSFRLTSGESLIDAHRSYQYVNFNGEKEGEIAPYVVLNFSELLGQLKSLAPSRIVAFGYFGVPASTAVTPLEQGRVRRCSRTEARRSGTRDRDRSGPATGTAEFGNDVVAARPGFKAGEGLAAAASFLNQVV